MTTPDYLPHNFVDGQSGGTPITAAILNDDEAAIVSFRGKWPHQGLRSFHMGLAGRQYVGCDILFIGDSISEGMGATVKNRRWIEQFVTLLRSWYPTTGVAGGEGYVPGCFISTSFASGWTYTGTSGTNYSLDGTYGFGHRSCFLYSGGAMTRTVYGTSVTINYTLNSGLGSANVYIDGSGTSSGTVNGAQSGSTGTTHDGGRLNISFGTRGSHTVRIAFNAAGSSYGFAIINGIHVYDQDEVAGIRLTDSAQHGSQSSNWSTATNANQYVLSDDISALQPDLVVIGLGANDRTSNSSSASLKTNLQTLISQVQAACTMPPSILLIGEYLEGTGNEAWSNYVAAVKSIADANQASIAFIDLTQRFPSANDNTLGWVYSDAVHPSDKGHAAIANYIAGFVMPT